MERGRASELSQVTEKQREGQKGEAEVGIAPALEELPHGAEWRQCLSKPTAGIKKKNPQKNPQLGLGRKPLV